MRSKHGMSLASSLIRLLPDSGVNVWIALEDFTHILCESGNDDRPPVVANRSNFESHQKSDFESFPIKHLLANLIYDAACLQT